MSGHWPRMVRLGWVRRRLGLGEFFAEVGQRRGSAVLEHAVFAIVANRLVAPCSKRHLIEWARDDVVMPTGLSTSAT